MNRVFKTSSAATALTAALYVVTMSIPAHAEQAKSEHHASSATTEHHATTAKSEHTTTPAEHTTTTTTSTEHKVEHHTGADGTQKVTEHHTTKQCRVSCVNPHAACTESEKVIETLRMLFDAVHKGDFETMSAHMDDGVTTFDEGTKKLIQGKEAVLADLKRKFETNKALGLESLTIDNPYAKVTGNVAVVTFVARKVYGGKKPSKMESHSTEIFVNEGGKWKKMHYRSNWKKIS